MTDDIPVVTCPACGLVGPEDEADTFSERSYGCPACGHVWPKDEEDDTDE